MPNNTHMKKEAILLLSILLLFIIACTPQSGERIPTDFRSGTEGLNLFVPPNLPPPQLYDDPDTTLQVVVELENRGAADVGTSGDKIYLSGFDNDLITNIKTTGEQIPHIEGKSQFGPGGFDVVTFEGIIRPLANVDKYEPTLLVTACYGYETIATTSVCIDPNPFSGNAQQKVCTPRTVSTGTQGGPLAVNSIELEPSPGKTRFRIYINNVGRGDAFRNGATYLNKCSPYSANKLQFDEIGYVRLTDVSLSGTSILNTCKPLADGHVRLVNGRATIFCEFNNIRQTTAYTTPLTVKLKYGYRDSLLRPVRIYSSGR
jgi:hypothetical protein